MEDIRDKCRIAMESALVSCRDDLKNIWTGGRPDPAVIENMVVEAYGSHLMVKEIASVAHGDGMRLSVTPFDQSTKGGLINKFISESLQVVEDSTVIWVTFPKSSDESKDIIARKVSSRCESAKVTVRQARKTANDELKKIKAQISDDEQRLVSKHIQEMTDGFCKDITSLYDKKKAEIYG